MNAYSSDVSHSVLRAWRVCVCGGTLSHTRGELFCQKLGTELAGEKGLMIVTGGFKAFADRPDVPSADWATVEGARRRLEDEGVPVDGRINTLLPEMDRPGTLRFRVGRIDTLRNRAPQARRFAVVSSADVLLAVGGDENTREMIDLAFALGKPCLPLPFCGGTADARWRENLEIIREQFGLDSSQAERLESVRLNDLTEDGICDLAAQVKQFLLRKLSRKCFVMMPFGKPQLPLYEQAIKPAIIDAGLTPVRSDHLDLVGNVVQVLRDAISACDCAVAVITGHNPNVLYELGLAHARGKPTVILDKYTAQGERLRTPPFDLANEYVTGYGDDLLSLRGTLCSLLQQL